MEEAGAWQLECENLQQRSGYLLTSGQWSDCTFMVGSETNQAVVLVHKLVLAMASPVFEAMFYGGLSEHNDPIISIPDVEPEAFRALLQYIYTGNINIGSFEMACNLLYGAKKYMLPHLVKQCNIYICTVVGPSNACRAYELARLFDEKTVLDKCIQIISTNTKEVLNDTSFEDVELNTVITVCSLDHLTVDSELDLFHAVERYAEAVQRRQGRSSPTADDGEPPSKKLCKSLQHPSTCEDKVLRPSVASSQTSPPMGQDSKPPTEVEPTADKKILKEVPEPPSIRAAVQKIRFLTLSAQEFAEGPARSDLLTKDESFAVIMNIASKESAVAMPTGFTECRETRQTNSALKKEVQSLEVGSLDHTINALNHGKFFEVQNAASAAAKLLRIPQCIQPALEKGILDALVPAITEGDHTCKDNAVCAIYNICARGSPPQLGVLAASAALEPYCRLLTGRGNATTRGRILRGLTHLLRKVEQNTRLALLQKLKAIGVPQLLMPLQHYANVEVRRLADNLLRTYFSNGQ